MMTPERTNRHKTVQRQSNKNEIESQIREEHDKRQYKRPDQDHDL